MKIFCHDHLLVALVADVLVLPTMQSVKFFSIFACIFVTGRACLHVEKSCETVSFLQLRNLGNSLSLLQRQLAGRSWVMLTLAHSSCLWSRRRLHVNLALLTIFESRDNSRPTQQATIRGWRHASYHHHQATADRCTYFAQPCVEQ